jgi:hypothetical protein
MGKLKRLLSRKKSSKADDQATDAFYAHEAKNQELERFPETDPEQASPSLTTATITDDEQEDEKPAQGAATSANPDSDVSAKISDSIDHEILLIKRNLNSDLEKEADSTAQHSATSVTTIKNHRNQNKTQNTAHSNEGMTPVEPPPWSTGHSSISAGIDRGVPFTVRPTGTMKVMGTQQQQQQQRRRFARSPTPPDELQSKPSGGEGEEEEGKGSTSRVGSSTGAMSGQGGGRENGVSIAALDGHTHNLEERSDLSAAGGGAIPPSPRNLSMAAGQTVDTTQFVNAQVVETLLKELRLAAAMEMSVYRGHISSAKDAGNITNQKSSTNSNTHSNRNKTQQPFAPARRITRTIMALGWPNIEGIMFGAKVVQALDQVTLNYSESFSSLATWWGNVVCIRSWLWVLTDHDITHGHNKKNAAETTAAIGGEKGGVAVAAIKNVEQLEAAIAVLEKKIFDLLVDSMWTTTRQYATCIINYAPSSSPTASSTSLPTVTIEEGATHTWIAAVTHTMALIKPVLTGDPLFGTLKGQLIKAVLGALDNAIVDSLLRPPTLPAPSAASLSPLGAKIKSARKHYKSSNNSNQILSENLLPYQRDQGNVAIGVSIKVFSQTIETWLTSAAAMTPVQHSNRVPLPLLSSTANLLTIPKQALLDPEVRKEALPDLPPSLIYQLLSLPVEEEEEEKVPSGLMKALKEEMKQQKGESNATPHFPYYYYPYQYECMDEKHLLSEGYVSSVNLRLSAESDDELEEMATKFSGDGDGDGDLCHRFHLLKELWT